MFVGELAQSCLIHQFFTIRFLFITFKAVSCLIHIGLAVAVRPPKAEVGTGELWEVLWREGHLLLSVGWQGYVFLECDVANPSLQRTAEAVAADVLDEHGRPEADVGAICFFPFSFFILTD